jgi:signal transduction histidine kinase
MSSKWNAELSEKAARLSAPKSLALQPPPNAERAYALVSVADSGPGLDLDNMDRLFDAFYTTKPQGLGMGLSISRSIIGAQWRRLWARTNVPKGALFQFTLPIGFE